MCKKMFGNRDVPDDIYLEEERPDGGKQTVRQDALESLALHLVYVAFSCFFGYVILRLLWLIEYNVPALEEIKFFTSFPLFPWCMQKKKFENAESEIVTLTQSMKEAEIEFTKILHDKDTEIKELTANMEQDQEKLQYQYLEQKKELEIVGNP